MAPLTGKLVLPLMFLALTSSSAWAGHTLSDQQQRTLAHWLSTHRAYRAATPVDCYCDEDIRQMRKGYGGEWKAVPDYTPYLATGDFNSDGVGDFAAVVFDARAKKDAFVLLIFNGPFTGNDQSPAFISQHLALERCGLFYGAPRPRPYRLLVSAFESEGAILMPKGSTYRLVWVEH